MSQPLLLRKLRKYVAALPALAFGFMASPAFSTIVTINAIFDEHDVCTNLVGIVHGAKPG